MHHKYYGEVLPYLEIKKQEAEEVKESIEMPDIEGMDVREAKKILKKLGLEVEINGEGEFVTEQLPKKGIQINTGTKVILYT